MIEKILSVKLYKSEGVEVGVEQSDRHCYGHAREGREVAVKMNQAVDGITEGLAAFQLCAVLCLKGNVNVSASRGGKIDAQFAPLENEGLCYDRFFSRAGVHRYESIDAEGYLVRSEG